MWLQRIERVRSTILTFPVKRLRFEPKPTVTIQAREATAINDNVVSSPATGRRLCLYPA